MRKRQRRGLALAAAALTGCLVVLIAPLAASPVLTPLSVVTNPALVSNTPITIALEEGFFAEQGLDVRLVELRESSQAWPLLIAGRVDVNAGGYSAASLQAILQGAKLRIVADKGHAGPGERGVALMVRQDLIDGGRFRTWKDLRGMVIGAPVRAGISELFLLQILRNRAFLTEDDLQLQQVRSFLLPEAFRGKAVDAAVVAEPVVTQLETLGLAKTVLTLHDVFPYAQQAVITYGPNILVRNPGLGQRFMHAYLRGVRQYSAGKTDRNLAITQKYTHQEESILRKSTWPQIYPDGHVNVDSIMRMQAWWVREGWLERVVDRTDFLEPEFARLAYKKLMATR